MELHTKARPVAKLRVASVLHTEVAVFLSTQVEMTTSAKNVTTTTNVSVFLYFIVGD